VATSRIAESVGRVLGGRYRLTRPLGVGASANVFVADDVNLRRRVAIKLLHPGLAGDEGFLRRFRAEAQAVASLRHPNILTVYDWGEDAGSPYLVTELLEGGTLRAMLDRDTLLSPSQAAAVGADAARALDYAHRRGIVHRDIKPANLIFDDEGRVRVADFGLARALAEATWTEPVGAVVGTARYAAPEQVRGERLDSRADVYSLALVMVEAITGTVPFATDTTIGTLMARVERPLKAPPETAALAPVLDAAGAVEPAARPDAGAFARRLDRAAAALPLAAPLQLASPIDTGEVEEDLVAPTEYPGQPKLYDHDRAEVHQLGEPASSSVAAGADDPSHDAGSGEEDQGSPDLAGAALASAVLTGAALAGPPGDGLPGDGLPDSAPVTAASPGEGSNSEVEPAETRSEASGETLALDDLEPAPASLAGSRRPFALPPTPGPRRRRRRLRRVLVATTGLLLVAAGTGLGLAASRAATTPTHPVPYVVGLTSTEAQGRLSAEKLAMAVTSSIYSAHQTKGTVLSQDPATGRLDEGKTVDVVVSLGPAPVQVPSLAGQDAAAAAQVLKDLGLVAGKQTEVYSMTVPAGHVISSSPDRGALLPGQSVNLVVSKGKPLAPVPAVGPGETITSYQAALRAAGLVGVESYVYSNTFGKGQVIGTTPAPGASLVVGSTVTVEVSKGPHLAVVPSLTGTSVGVATQQLSAAGFQVTGVRGNPINSVTATSPAGGTVVLYGSPIVIVTN
jgi:serine/threonine-protein kinase